MPGGCVRARVVRLQGDDLHVEPTIDPCQTRAIGMHDACLITSFTYPRQYLQQPATWYYATGPPDAAWRPFDAEASAFLLKMYECSVAMGARGLLLDVEVQNRRYDIDLLYLRQHNAQSGTTREIRLFPDDHAESMCAAVPHLPNAHLFADWQRVHRIGLGGLPDTAREQLETDIGIPNVLGIFRWIDPVSELQFKGKLEVESLRAHLTGGAYADVSLLWHGTKMGTWHSCAAEGMHPGYAHSSLSHNGSLLGKGFYGARNLRTAMRYAPCGDVPNCPIKAHATLLVETITGVVHACGSYNGASAPPRSSCTSDLAGDRHCIFESSRACIRFIVFWAYRHELPG